ncbi:MAG: hypothetical protein AUI01_08225 [Ktedonobacter sp. 13_2_20CM_2_56_8]|nr:MAG: hypothetical protein AUI01_08225 [Ktedonobacter sp. 13_2_20CM_2_56_8]
MFYREGTSLKRWTVLNAYLPAYLIFFRDHVRSPKPRAMVRLLIDHVALTAHTFNAVRTSLRGLHTIDLMQINAPLIHF